jgi:Zn finger protein HypA/HybF involved in hydrogenase expression
MIGLVFVPPPHTEPLRSFHCGDCENTWGERAYFVHTCPSCESVDVYADDEE